MTGAVAEIRITRQLETPRCTIGRLVLSMPPESAIVECYTLELPVGAGAIPEGRWATTLYRSPKFRMTLPRIHVPRRGVIEIHSGNTIADTRGCVLVGDSIDRSSDPAVLLASRAALRRIMHALDLHDGQIWTIVSGHGPDPDHG
jgi:hypothetical protein